MPKKAGLRKKTEYSDEFNAIWLCFGHVTKAGLGKRGFKNEAWLEWNQIEDRPAVRVMIDALSCQAKGKLAERKKTGRDPEKFKHACRWFKYRCWEGDEDLETIPDFKEAKQSKLDKLTDRGWAEG